MKKEKNFRISQYDIWAILSYLYINFGEAVCEYHHGFKGLNYKATFRLSKYYDNIGIDFPFADEENPELRCVEIDYDSIPENAKPDIEKYIGKQFKKGKSKLKEQKNKEVLIIEDKIGLFLFLIELFFSKNKRNNNEPSDIKAIKIYNKFVSSILKTDKAEQTPFEQLISEAKKEKYKDEIDQEKVQKAVENETEYLKTLDNNLFDKRLKEVIDEFYKAANPYSNKELKLLEASEYSKNISLKFHNYKCFTIIDPNLGEIEYSAPESYLSAGASFRLTEDKKKEICIRCNSTIDNTNDYERIEEIILYINKEIQGIFARKDDDNEWKEYGDVSLSKYNCKTMTYDQKQYVIKTFNEAIPIINSITTENMCEQLPTKDKPKVKKQIKSIHKLKTKNNR
jgi:hypothetical protein